MQRRSPIRPALLAAAVLHLAGCASDPGGEPGDEVPADWFSDGVVSYRLLEKEDFQAPRSNSLWGNVAHGAEICTHILPTADHDETGAFRAVMQPRCSFWAVTTDKIATLGGLAGTSVVPGLPSKQPDWYVLQHEQIHFAIMEVAALRLSRQMARLPPEERRTAAVATAYNLTLARAQEQHARFDSATSGIYDPRRLEVWVRVMEKEMRKLCGREPHCWVRHRSPMGWGK